MDEEVREMKIDFNYNFTEPDGTLIPERPPEMVENDKGEMEKKKYPTFTLKKACINVLLGSKVVEAKCPKCQHKFDKPEEVDGEEKLRRFQLTMQIQNSKDLLDVGTKDIELLKERIAAVYPTLTSGQAWAILDPHSEKK